MYQKQVVVKSVTGLHARPGTMVAELALKFNSNITIEFNDAKINAKEILEILTSNINCGDNITITAEGPDEQEAVVALEELISKE